MIKELKTASTKNKAPIWSKIAEMAQKPKIAKRIVNLRSEEHTSELQSH